MRISEKRLLRRRAEFEEIKAPEEALCSGLEEFCDLAYADDFAPEHRLDLVRPAGADGALPVIVHIHGGGLSLGSRAVCRTFCRELSRNGFLVCSLEYSLAPEAYAYRQLAEVSKALRFLETVLPDYGGRNTEVFLSGDDAGALLAVYTAAMQQSGDMAACANVAPPGLPIRALGLINGLLYSCRKDGIFSPRTLWGPFYRHCDFTPYTDPEHPEIAGSLPPCYLASDGSRPHQRHMQDFAEALEKYGIPRETDIFPETPEPEFPVYPTALLKNPAAAAHLAAFFSKQSIEPGAPQIQP